MTPKYRPRRKPAQFPAKLYVAGKVEATQVTNISDGGVCLAGVRVPVEGDVVRVVAAGFDFVGRVMWRRGDRAGIQALGGIGAAETGMIRRSLGRPAARAAPLLREL